jgi:polygalacturonase
MLIEDCYISTGDDGIVIESGWDQYEIGASTASLIFIQVKYLCDFLLITFY